MALLELLINADKPNEKVVGLAMRRPLLPKFPTKYKLVVKNDDHPPLAPHCLALESMYDVPRSMDVVIAYSTVTVLGPSNPLGDDLVNDEVWQESVTRLLLGGARLLTGNIYFKHPRTKDVRQFLVSITFEEEVPGNEDLLGSESVWEEVVLETWAPADQCDPIAL